MRDAVQNTNQPASKTRMILMWIILVGNVIFWSAFWIWRQRGRAPAMDSEPLLFHVIFWILAGGFFLVVSMGSYLLCVFTACLTFDFTRPAWSVVKGKLFVANILVPLGASLGVGFGLSAFLTPVLKATGLDAGMANILPVLGAVMLFQIAQMWVLIWAPLEKRLIERRLLAQGITAAQLQTGFFVRLSNPASGMLKRFGVIEEDMGALWVGPDLLIYWGDGESFSLTRDQVIQIERKADARSTTVLAGIAHVILHVNCLGAAQRRIRLHTEGHLTMGQKRQAMNRLADAIIRWHSSAVVALPI